MNKKSLLIIESDVIAAGFLQKIGEKTGFTCQACTTGEEAINRIQEGQKRGNYHDIILLDLHLQGIDGVDLCEILRGKTPAPNKAIISVPSWIIACSFDSSPITINALLRTGADDFVPKPLDQAMFTARLITAITNIYRYGKRRNLHHQPA